MHHRDLLLTVMILHLYPDHMYGKPADNVLILPILQWIEFIHVPFLQEAAEVLISVSTHNFNDAPSFELHWTQNDASCSRALKAELLDVG